MEIEFKFCIPPERLAAVQAAVRRGRWVTVRMEARYFDTPDGALASRGIAFRLRREGDQWVQTVKALGDGPLDRQEHNVARGPATAGAAPEPLPQLHDGTVAGARLLQALQAASGPLEETYGTEMDRMTRDITRQGAVVELALDTGRVVAHRGTPQQAEAPICELELELKAGTVAGLAALATQWSARHGLFLSTVSKAERGERLLAAPGGRPARKPRPLTYPSLPLPPGPALQRAVVAHCLQQMVGPASDIAEGANDDEQVHQLRIGIRRLRTALRELAPLAPGSFDPAWEPPLVDVFQQLGHLRDRSQVMERIETELHAAGAPHLPSQKSADAGQATAAHIVRNAAFQGALVGLMAFTTQGLDATGDDPAGLDTRATRRLLQHRLRALHAQVQKGTRGFAARTPQAQHRLRKRLKRLRYLTEFVAPALDAHSARFLDSLQPALSALGRLNDERVAAALYRESAEAGKSNAWFGVGWLAGRQALAVAACEQALAHVAEAPRLRKASKR
ncbi:adenylate cyclase [Acidovorax sp. 107]|uniref:CYTH and CHAD domain-containing protein n=1 Tax=Acidovorax sp. 107 TaxID=2135638 RepID=UPI000D3A7D56|nr:CYTH and CHAD domain-containing protein [Acidovorax sp. 107]PUA96234.1 adenylate cyclase [Acidovorax sp. 107]